MDSTLACQAPWAWVEDSESIGTKEEWLELRILHDSREEDEKVITDHTDYEKSDFLY